MSLGVAVLQRSEPHSPDPISVAELEHDRVVPQSLQSFGVTTLRDSFEIHRYLFS